MIPKKLTDVLEAVALASGAPMAVVAVFDVADQLVPMSTALPRETYFYVVYGDGSHGFVSFDEGEVAEGVGLAGMEAPPGLH